MEKMMGLLISLIIVVAISNIVHYSLSLMVVDKQRKLRFCKLKA